MITERLTKINNPEAKSTRMRKTPARSKQKKRQPIAHAEKKKQEINISKPPKASKINFMYYRFIEQIAEKIRLSRDTRLAINQDTKDTNHRRFQAKLTKRTTSNAFGSSFKRQIKDIFQKIYLELWSWITEPKGRSPRTRGERHSMITTGSCANRCRWKLLKNL